MKKLFLIVFSTLLTATLAACNPVSENATVSFNMNASDAAEEKATSLVSTNDDLPFVFNTSGDDTNTDSQDAAPITTSNNSVTAKVVNSSLDSIISKSSDTKSNNSLNNVKTVFNTSTATTETNAKSQNSASSQTTSSKEAETEAVKTNTVDTSTNTNTANNNVSETTETVTQPSGRWVTIRHHQLHAACNKCGVDLSLSGESYWEHQDNAGCYSGYHAIDYYTEEQVWVNYGDPMPEQDDYSHYGSWS